MKVVNDIYQYLHEALLISSRRFPDHPRLYLYNLDIVSPVWDSVARDVDPLKYVSCKHNARRYKYLNLGDVGESFVISHRGNIEGLIGQLSKI